MEYVEGIPIDEYSANMELRDRLILLLRVCEGVSHAHHRLIIHRDLKPTNILVDSSGQPKLLDFGIAKLLAESRDRTQTAERMLTPNYASPEQISGTPETTATDVYSLGAVLHKILRGYSPNEEPQSTPPPVPRDVEFILRKALRAEPEERYISVEAFANDIRAFLGWQPVEARSGDTWYRTRKFLRRYWVPVCATVLLIAGLSAGLYAVNRERKITQRRFDQVRQLSAKVLALDSAIRGLPGSTKARNDIVAMSKEYLESLFAESTADNNLDMEVAEALFKLAEVQGVPAGNNLGQYAQADESLVKADTLVERRLAVAPNDQKALFLSASINHDRMILADSNHRRNDELRFAGKSAAQLDKLYAIGGPPGSDRADAIRRYSNVALAYKNLHRYDESVRYGRRAVDLGRPMRDATVAVASALSVIADSLRYSGDLDGALSNIKEARSVLDGFEFPNEVTKVNTLNNVLWRQGIILGGEGSINLSRPEEGISVLQQALDLIEAAAKKDPYDASPRMLFVMTGHELGKILSQRNPERALAVFDQALVRVGEVKNNSKARRGEAELLADSSYPLRRLSRTAQAEQRIDKAFDLLRQTKDYPASSISMGDETETVMSAFGDHLADTGHAAQAAEVYRDLLDKLNAAHPDFANDLAAAADVSRLYAALGRVYLAIGDKEQALTVSVTRLKLWQTWDKKIPNNTFIQRELAAAATP
jgi:tetratricopeptide (TPR) repeat protein